MTPLEALRAEKAPYVRVLTLRQPYASMVADGFKTIETRTSDVMWRGVAPGSVLAIHAAKGPPIHCDPKHVERYRTVRRASGFRRLWDLPIDTWPRGEILALVFVGAVRRLRRTRADELAACCYATGLTAIELRAAQVLPHPIPFRGVLGFGRLPMPRLEQAFAPPITLQDLVDWPPYVPIAGHAAAPSMEWFLADQESPTEVPGHEGADLVGHPEVDDEWRSQEPDPNAAPDDLCAALCALNAGHTLVKVPDSPDSQFFRLFVLRQKKSADRKETAVDDACDP